MPQPNQTEQFNTETVPQQLLAATAVETQARDSILTRTGDFFQDLGHSIIDIAHNSADYLRHKAPVLAAIGGLAVGGAASALSSSESSAASSQEKDPTANLASYSSPQVKRWAKRADRECTDNLIVSLGHNNKTRKGNKLKRTETTDHRATYRAYLKENMTICESFGATNNRKVRKGMMRFLKREKGYKIYSYTDTQVAASKYATDLVQVYIRPKK